MGRRPEINKPQTGNHSNSIFAASLPDLSMRRLQPTPPSLGGLPPLRISSRLFTTLHDVPLKNGVPVEPFGRQKHRYSRVRTRGFEPPPSQLRTRSLVWRVCQFRHVRSLGCMAKSFDRIGLLVNAPFETHAVFQDSVSTALPPVCIMFRQITAPLAYCVPDKPPCARAKRHSFAIIWVV